jgi:hypothetical protein
MYFSPFIADAFSSGKSPSLANNAAKFISSKTYLLEYIKKTDPIQ